MRQLIHSEEREGFTVRLYVEPEDMDPAELFDLQEDIDAVNRGDWLWFQVHCVASRKGIELGHDYLGGCAYEHYADFLEPGGYAVDMCDSAVAEARAALAKLCAP